VIESKKDVGGLKNSTTRTSTAFRRLLKRKSARKSAERHSQQPNLGASPPYRIIRGEVKLFAYDIKMHRLSREPSKSRIVYFLVV
jgi:hypothetical protein